MNTTSPDTESQTAYLAVTEIYKSVQGESTWAGLPCVFVRLTGCPLRCVWCDTAYAFTGGDAMNVTQVVDAVKALDCSLVEITGGEPLGQRNCGPLAQALLDEGFTVLCETSGALPIDQLPDAVIKIMDLKCPGSGEEHRNDWNNLAKLAPRDEVKFVIADRTDYEWARDKTREHDLPSKVNAVLFSPVFGAQDAQELVEWILEDELDVRFQLQLHKFVWPPDTKGV
jgi:7-carboxy-7-deazaguanine synthase